MEAYMREDDVLTFRCSCINGSCLNYMNWRVLRWEPLKSYQSLYSFEPFLFCRHWLTALTKRVGLSTLKDCP